MHGYDFDNTIAYTSELHEVSWNYALGKLGIDPTAFVYPQNSGFPLTQATERIYDALLFQQFSVSLDKQEVVTRLLHSKIEGMMRYDSDAIQLNDETVAYIKNSPQHHKVIVTNNVLEVVLFILEKKELIEYFTYLVCEDFSYDMRTKIRIPSIGSPKPHTESYTHAAKQFSFPTLERFYGDHAVFDKQFARSMDCEFVLI